MSKQTNQMTVRYKPMLGESSAGCKWEHSLNTIFSPGCYVVEIEHNGVDVGLPVDDCGEEHYIVGNLVVTDSGTAGPKQHGRLTGQMLTFTVKAEKETRAYIRTFADGEWGEWHRLIESNMFEYIDSNDKLLATVDSLVDKYSLLTGSGEGSVEKSINDALAVVDEKLTAENERASEADADIMQRYGYIDTDDAVLQKMFRYINLNCSLSDVTVQGIPTLDNFLTANSSIAFYVWNSDGTVKKSIRFTLSDSVYDSDNVYCLRSANGVVIVDFTEPRHFATSSRSNYRLNPTCFLAPGVESELDAIKTTMPKFGYTSGVVALDTTAKALTIPSGSFIAGCGTQVLLSEELVISPHNTYGAHYIIIDLSTLVARTVDATNTIIYSEKEALFGLVRWAEGIVWFNSPRQKIDGAILDYKIKPKADAVALADEISRATAAEEELRAVAEKAADIYSSNDNTTVIALNTPYRAGDSLRITLLANEQESGSPVAVYPCSADGTLEQVFVRLTDVGDSDTVTVAEDTDYIILRGAAIAYKSVSIENFGGEASRAQSAESEILAKVAENENILNTIAKGYIYSSNDNVTTTSLVEQYKKGDLLRVTLLANEQVNNANVAVYGFTNETDTSQKLATLNNVGDSVVTCCNIALNYVSVRGVHLKYKSVRIESLSSNMLALQEYATVPCMYNPRVDIKKDNLKILDIGNSYTQDSHAYLSQLLEAAGVDCNFSLYKAVRGSASFYTWWNCYNDKDTAAYTISLTAGNAIDGIEGSGVAGDGTLFRNALSAVDWDIIIIHQVSTYAGGYYFWNQQGTSSGSLRELIQIIRATNPSASIGWLGVHSYKGNYSGNAEGSSLARWEKIAHATKLLQMNYGIDFIIPYGTAVQNLRASSLDDGEEFSTDGTHLATGLGDYVASCCYFQSLFAPRFGVSVVGNSCRADVDETVAGAKSITDETAPVAQKAALLATCNMYEVMNPDDY